MKPIYKVLILILMLLMVLVSCNNPTPRYPITYKGNSEFDEIINQNKRLVALQDRAFKSYIAEHPELHFINSQFGFWYAYLKQNSASNKVPKPSETVIFNYQIEDIDNQIIYQKEDLGEQSYVIDKEQREIGLQKGLKLMKENEEVTFLFPSFLAYGVLGDRKKIKTNQPLIYTVYLKQIINNKNNQK